MVYFLSSLPHPLKGLILAELQKRVLECIKDQHGNHVIQKCFTSVPPSLMQLLINPILGSVSYDIAKSLHLSPYCML